MEKDPSLEHFTRWAKNNAVPIDPNASNDEFIDLAPLKEMVGDARVVGFGESQHYVAEFNRFRSRLFKYLVTEMNFTTFAFECGVVEAKCTHDYVLGAHDRVDDAIMGITGCFGVWQEIKDLLQWMRDYNLSDRNKRKLNFYGFDGSQGWSCSGNAVSFACTFLDQVDVNYSITLREELLPLAESINLDNIGEKPIDVIRELNYGLMSLVARFQIEQMQYIERSSWEDFDWANRAALIALQIGSLLAEVGAAPEASSRTWWNMRDACMALYLRWILDREGPDARLLVGAHNIHLQKTFAREGTEFDQTTMIQHLSFSLPKNDMFIIAATNYYSLKPDDPALEYSFQDALGRLELPSFVLDLRPAANEKTVANWLNKKTPDRSNTMYQLIGTADAWDAVYYTQQIELDKLSLPTPLERTFITLKGDRLDGLDGVYDIVGVIDIPVVLRVTREGNRLMTSGMESDGELFPIHRSELFPLSDSRFGWAEWPMWIEFERDTDGAAHSVSLGFSGERGNYLGEKRA